MISLIIFCWFFKSFLATASTVKLGFTPEKTNGYVFYYFSLSMLGWHFLPSRGRLFTFIYLFHLISYDWSFHCWDSGMGFHHSCLLLFQPLLFLIRSVVVLDHVTILGHNNVLLLAEPIQHLHWGRPFHKISGIPPFL